MSNDSNLLYALDKNMICFRIDGKIVHADCTNLGTIWFHALRSERSDETHLVYTMADVGNGWAKRTNWENEFLIGVHDANVV